VAFYNQNSFWYFSEAQYQRRVPEITARFQVSRLATHHPSEWHRAQSIPYVTANLIALKQPMPRNGGPLLW
jgi:O-antigen biosynthesis protein